MEAGKAALIVGMSGETRSSGNRVQISFGRLATIRSENGGTLTIRAENSEGLNVVGSCQFAEDVGSKDGEITFTGSGFACGGGLFGS